MVESRSTDQMHHEDRAGVNAVIRGVDRIATARLPVLIVMCTNREAALDPAVVRRASAHFHFGRPNAEQREHLLRRAFDGVLSANDLAKLTRLTGTRNGRDYGLTYSDITDRLIPSILLEAFPDRAISYELAEAVCRRTEATRPFDGAGKVVRA